MGLNGKAAQEMDCMSHSPGSQGQQETVCSRRK